ncbi:MAG: hypothetical protein HZB63_08095 [Deltaproteobacteria bacterium]|nr:hypothetical protein [Deltaproteobacteria bacterium]
MMQSYLELVHQRIEDRSANVLQNIEKFDDVQLRFTVRIFADCLDEETRKRLLGNYSEYLTQSEIREFVKGFIPAYTEYALVELVDKKRDGERFDPPWLTQEEYQEMSVREKWPRIVGNLNEVAPLQLCRELAKTGLLLRPYMLSDPGFNEGALEFALYFDLRDRLGGLSEEELRSVAASVAPLVDRAVSAVAGEECEETLRRIRLLVATAAGLSIDPQEMIGPLMERYPREGPPGWKVRELGKTLETMSLRDLRLTAFVHLDLLTAEETREIVSPFVSRWPSFFEIPTRYLRELILAIVERIPDRALTFFFERYSGGRMTMTPGVSFFVWKLMPEEEKIERLREDNARMDQAMMARHLARYLMSGTPEELVDPGRQIALLTDNGFPVNHGSILKSLGGEAGDARLRKLYDEVTLLSLRMMSAPENERHELYREIRLRIAEAAGISPNTMRGGS